MTANQVCAAAAAFLLGTATFGGATLSGDGPGLWPRVRAEVGEPLQQAQALAAAGDYKGAMTLVDKASAVADKTGEETSTIGQVKAYIGAKSGDISLGGATAAKNKLASDYSAKNYAAVIADGDALSKAGALDPTSAAVVAQAYYLSGNKAGCIKYIKGVSGADEAALQLEMKCAFDINDSATQRDALEQLIARTGKADYWTQLIKMGEQAKNLTDPQTLQLARLSYLTNTLAGKDDYINMAQLDMQLVLPAEAATVLDKGTAAGLLNDDRAKKLQTIAKQQAGQVASGHGGGAGRGQQGSERRCADQGLPAAIQRRPGQGRRRQLPSRAGQDPQGQGQRRDRARLGSGCRGPVGRRDQDLECRQGRWQWRDDRPSLFACMRRIRLGGCAAAAPAPKGQE